MGSDGLECNGGNLPFAVPVASDQSMRRQQLDFQLVSALKRFFPFFQRKKHLLTKVYHSLIAFFTPFITGDINFAYGYVFAGCNLFAVFFVYFFLPETSGRSLEEIDTMFLLEIKPWKSSKWEPPRPEDLITADKLRLNTGARGITKKQEANGAEAEQQETLMMSQSGGHQQQNRSDLPHVPVVSGPEYHLGAGVRGDSFVRA